MNTPTPGPETSDAAARRRTGLYVAAAALAGVIVAGTVGLYVATHSDDSDSTIAAVTSRPSVAATTTTDPSPAFIRDFRSNHTYTITNTDESLISLAKTTAGAFPNQESDADWHTNYAGVRNILVQNGFTADLAKDFIVKSVKYFGGIGAYAQTDRLAATIVELKTKLTAGVYGAGTDIEAGTYKTTGGSRCYYEVRPSVTSTKIVDNDNLQGQGYFAVAEGQGVKIAGDCVFEKQN